MDPVTYRNANGDERVVTSVERGIAAEFDGFYPPGSPSAKALSAAKAAETRKANAEKAGTTQAAKAHAAVADR